MAVIAAVEIVRDGPGRLRLAPIADYSTESILANGTNNVARELYINALNPGNALSYPRT